jgi:C4-dicarboxylate-specific signal transduction histidine kinase
MQMEVAHANRVATMGQLTASIAHEVNQPIAAAVTNAEAALRWLGARPPNLAEVQQALDHIVKDAKRAGDVIGRIREIVKKAPTRKDPLDINEAILEVIELTRGEAAKNGASVQTPLAEGFAADRRRSRTIAASRPQSHCQRCPGNGRGRRGTARAVHHHRSNRTE